MSGYSLIGSVKMAIGAGQDDDDRQHGGEDRPVDEEAGETHGRLLELGDWRPVAGLASALASMGPAVAVTFMPGPHPLRPLTTIVSPGLRPLGTTR